MPLKSKKRRQRGDHLDGLPVSLKDQQPLSSSSDGHGSCVHNNSLLTNGRLQKFLVEVLDTYYDISARYRHSIGAAREVSSTQESSSGNSACSVGSKPGVILEQLQTTAQDNWKEHQGCAGGTTTMDRQSNKRQQGQFPDGLAARTDDTTSCTSASTSNSSKKKRKVVGLKKESRDCPPIAGAVPSATTKDAPVSMFHAGVLVPDKPMTSESFSAIPGESKASRRRRMERINGRKRRARKIIEIDCLNEQFHDLTRRNTCLRGENDKLREMIDYVKKMKRGRVVFAGP